MESQDKLDNLADTMFEIMEDISRVEETIEQRIKAFESLESSLKTLQDTQDSHSKKLESLDNLLERFNKLEQNINSIANSDVLKLLNQKIDKKILLKNEIAKYQKMILLILLLLAFGSIAFFTLGFTTSMNAIIVFIAVALCFIIALLVINSNLKIVISQEKSTPKKVATKQQAKTTSNAESTPKKSDTSNNEMEIKSTFDDF